MTTMYKARGLFGSLGEALNLGATLITVEDNVSAIRDATAIDIPEGQFLRMENRLTLGSGCERVEISEVATILIGRICKQP